MATFSGTATGAARKLSHSLSLWTTVALMLGTVAFVYRDARRRTGETKYGPFLLTLAGAALICADPVRHVLQDEGAWPHRPDGVPYAPSFAYSNQFVGGDCTSEGFRCLSLVGWTVTVGATWTGFALLLSGTFWNAKVLDKLAAVRAEWAALRHREWSHGDGHAYVPLPGPGAGNAGLDLDSDLDDDDGGESP